jgi:hypothetical protein
LLHQPCWSCFFIGFELIGLVGHIISLSGTIGIVRIIGLVGHNGLVGFIGLIGHNGLVGFISLGVASLLGPISLIDLSALSNHLPIGLIGVIGFGLIASSASATSLACRIIGLVSLVILLTHRPFCERLAAEVIEATQQHLELPQYALSPCLHMAQCLARSQIFSQYAHVLHQSFAKETYTTLH